MTTWVEDQIEESGKKGTFLITRRGVARVYFLAWQSLQESGG